MKKILIGTAHAALGLIIFLSFIGMFAASNHGKMELLIAAAILSFSSLYGIYEIDNHLRRKAREEAEE